MWWVDARKCQTSAFSNISVLIRPIKHACITNSIHHRLCVSAANKRNKHTRRQASLPTPKLHRDEQLTMRFCCEDVTSLSAAAASLSARSRLQYTITVLSPHDTVTLLSVLSPHDTVTLLSVSSYVQCCLAC